MIVLLALSDANLTRFDAKLELSADEFDILSGPSHSKMRCGSADFGTVEASADTLTHIHLLS